MLGRKLSRALLAGAALISLASCETPEPRGADLATTATRDPKDPAPGETFNPLGQPVLIEPKRATTTQVIVNNQPVQKYWASMTPEEIKRELDLTETVIQVQKTGTSGSVTPAFGSVTLSKGTYRISFSYMQYKNEACGAGANSGFVRAGVGLVATAIIDNKQNKLTISGLLPLVAAAENSKVSGSLTIRTMGITSKSSILAGYVGQNLQLTTESVVKAMESMAVVKAVLESQDANLSPNYLAVSSSSDGKPQCLNVVNGDSKPTQVLGTQILISDVTPLRITK